MRAWLLALVVAAATQTGRPPPSAPPGDLVRIDVIATDARGRPVENLAAADFELREDGVLRSLVDVRFVKIDPAGAATAGAAAAGASAADERAGAAREDTRLLGIYLDDYYVSPSGAARVKDVLHRLVDHDLGSNDLVTIMRPLDSLLTIRLTRDREILHRAIDAFEGRRGDYEPRSAFERNYMVNERGRADLQRTQATWSTLNALALHLANLGQGRKTMLLVSEQADPVLRRRGLETLPTSSSVMRTANRSNVSIYVLDPRDASARAASPDEGPNLLRVLADDTDGALLTTSTTSTTTLSPTSSAPGVSTLSTLPVLSNEAAALSRGLQRMVADASAYYLLTYRSDRNGDGLFHAVDVTVKKARGVQLRARKGYWAPTPDEIQRANMLEHANDPRPSPPLPPARHISPLIRPWFGMARGADGKTRVTFVWEPAGAVPGDRRVRTPSRVAFTALGADGAILFAGPVRPSGVALDSRGEAARALFDVTPGRLRLQMSIEDSADQPLDSDVRDLIVGDYFQAAVVVGTPEVLRARTARDVRALDADPGAVPVAAREFSRAERLVVRVPAYAAGVEKPAVSARLVSGMPGGSGIGGTGGTKGTGRAMRQLVVDAAATPDGRHQIDLPLAGLAPGEYSIEITATSPAGAATDAVRFRVTN